MAENQPNKFGCNGMFFSNPALCYKAVDPELNSLGLKRVTPIQYRIGKWVFPREAPQEGQYTPGGLWVAKHTHFIHWLENYLAEKYERPMLVYSCEIGKVLWESCNRIKTDKVMLLELVY